MLSSAQQTQLATWLGQGAFTAFTNIFSFTPGKTLDDFLAATAGKGPTFIVCNVSGSAYGVPSNLPAQLIGGYNPQNWEKGTHITLPDADRTAFIFNLTNTTIQRQNLIGQGDEDSGSFQTSAGGAAAGIAFGSGPRARFDICINADLVIGNAFNCSYGGTSGGTPIAFGTATPPDTAFQVTQLDVYSFSLGSSPVAPSNARISISTSP